MLGLFTAREKVLSVVPIIVVSRYIQLVSYFSSPGCLDPFILLYDVHPALAQMLLKALETVIHFHDKKLPNMRNYVAGISARILLLSDQLTPLLESTIVSRPELLLCVKERLVERLVLWLLDYINQGNVFSGNKIANLLCKVIEQYPLYMGRSEEALFHLELETLAQYLLPLYKQLTSGENTAI